MRTFVLLLAATAVEAFNLARPLPLRPAAAGVAAARATTVEMQFGQQKNKIPTLEERGYWAGEWVCADCGYIYEPNDRAPFEELLPRWKCPQCAGPRRRFVKKAGTMVGKLDDSALINGTVLAAVLIAALVYVGLTI